SLTDPTRIVVQPVTEALSPGVYDSEITLQFSDGFVRRAGIRTIVKPAPSTPSKTALDDASGCTSTKLVPVITTLGQSFGVPASWPINPEANVQDDCGNPLGASGNVTVAFSNADPPLSMQALDGGTWTTTWASGFNAGPVTVTVTAEDSARN